MLADHGVALQSGDVKVRKRQSVVSPCASELGESTFMEREEYRCLAERGLLVDLQ